MTENNQYSPNIILSEDILNLSLEQNVLVVEVDAAAEKEIIEVSSNPVNIDIYEDVSIVEISSGSAIQGPAGPKGDAAATITVGTTTTGANGSPAAVTNSGTSSAVVLNFTIPQGAKGDTGLKGDVGDPGIDGDSAYEIAVANGFTGTEEQWLDSLVGADGAPGPKGDPGDDGLPGTQGATGEPGVVVQATPPTETDILWLDTTVAGIMGQGPGVAAGGTVGQYLTKVDGTDYNTQWSTLDLSGKQDVVPNVSSIEIGYLDGVTASIQTQLDNKSTASKNEALTNKTISLATNALSGSTDQFNTALTDDNFVTINGYDYPKNKSFDRTNRLMGAYNTVAGFDTSQGDYGPVDTSSSIIYIGGSTPNSNFSLPSTSSLNYGESLTLINTSTVTINVKTNSGTLVNVLDAGHVWKYTYTNTTGTGVISGWMAHQIGFSNGRITIDATTPSDIDPLIIKSKNLHGGTGFSGIQTWTNTTAGATKPNKYWRMTTDGTLEVVNSDYTGVIFSLTDAGVLNINGAQLDNNAWTPFTPALSTESGTWTIGNGSIEAAYKVIGKTCHFRAKIMIGSTTNIGAGTLNIGLPLTAANANYQFPVSLLDAGQAWYQATANGMYLNNTSKFAMICISNGTVSSSQGVTNNFPFPFLDQDYISVSGSYEIA